MKTQNQRFDLKSKLIKVMKDFLSLEDFESWLYTQEDLSNQMNDEFILSLFLFNYKTGNKCDLLTTVLYPNFDLWEECFFYKVKTDLQYLAEGKLIDQVLDEFRHIEREHGVGINRLWTYRFGFEDAREGFPVYIIPFEFQNYVDPISGVTEALKAHAHKVLTDANNLNPELDLYKLLNIL